MKTGRESGLTAASAVLLLLIGAAQGTWAQKVEVYDLGHYHGGTWAEPRDINNSGVVVGFGDIASTYARPIGVSISGPNAGQWFDLGTLGGERSFPYVMCMAIANTGMIVGHTATKEDYVQAFAWRKQSGMVDIGTLNGHTFSLAYGTNKAGTLIVGWSGSEWFAQDTLPVVWTPEVVRTSGGQTATWAIQKLDTEGFEQASYWYATFVNNSGQIIGTAWDDSAGAQIAVLWNRVPDGKGWKIVKLPASSDYPNAWPNDINDWGEIVGDVVSPDWGTALPALWKPAAPQGNTWNLTVLPTLSGSPQGWNEALGINNPGDIVGDSNDANWNWLAARWSTKDLNSVQVLGFPGTWSFALKVNDNGIAAGAYGNDTIPENVAAVRFR